MKIQRCARGKEFKGVGSLNLLTFNLISNSKTQFTKMVKILFFFFHSQKHYPSFHCYPHAYIQYFPHPPMILLL